MTNHAGSDLLCGGFKNMRPGDRGGRALATSIKAHHQMAAHALISRCLSVLFRIVIISAFCTSKSISAYAKQRLLLSTKM